MEAYVHAREAFGMWCSRESSRDVDVGAGSLACAGLVA